MKANADPKPAGTGQEGAKPPTGVSSGTPVSTSPEKRIKKMADDAAKKGFARQRRNDATGFTK